LQKELCGLSAAENPFNAFLFLSLPPGNAALGIEIVFILLDLQESFLLMAAVTESLSIGYVVSLCWATLICAAFTARKFVVFYVFGHDCRHSMKDVSGGDGIKAICSKWL